MRHIANELQMRSSHFRRIKSAALIRSILSLRDDRGKASKMETNEKPERQNSAVADAKAEVQIAMNKAASDDSSDGPQEYWASHKTLEGEWRKKNDGIMKEFRRLTKMFLNSKTIKRLMSQTLF